MCMCRLCCDAMGCMCSAVGHRGLCRRSSRVIEGSSRGHRGTSRVIEHRGIETSRGLMTDARGHRENRHRGSSLAASSIEPCIEPCIEPLHRGIEAGAQAIWAPTSPHAISHSMPPLTVSSAVESRRLTLRRKNRYPRCVLQAVEGALLRSIDCGPRTALEPMVELDSRVC